jgi:phage FluMu protein Com
MSDIQVTDIKCTHCSKTYAPFNTAHGAISKLCPKCRENQQRSDEKRKNRVRNYQAEAKRNLETNWKMFQSKSVDKRQKECSLTKEQYFDIIQKPCSYCDYFNENEINGIDRVDNLVGYTFENSIPACKHCNRMKHILHPVFFLGKAALISKFQKGLLEATERNEF